MNSIHTPGTWRKGKHGSCVVSDSPKGLTIPGAIEIDPVEVSFYGGNLIGESISPCNIPIIVAAPRLFAALVEDRAIFALAGLTDRVRVIDELLSEAGGAA